MILEQPVARAAHPHGDARPIGVVVHAQLGVAPGRGVELRRVHRQDVGAVGRIVAVEGGLRPRAGQGGVGPLGGVGGQAIQISIACKPGTSKENR